MKKSKSQMLIMGLSLLLLFCTLAHSEDPPLTPPDWALKMTVYAGQTLPVGNVFVWNDADYLYVRYAIWGYWRMSETHLAVACSLEEIPVNPAGNPVPGQFPYHSDDEPPVKNQVYMIPMSDFPCSPLYLAAHCVLVDLMDCDFNETGWALSCTGIPFPNAHSWGRYFLYYPIFF